jgi:hypothetical protein
MFSDIDVLFHYENRQVDRQKAFQSLFKIFDPSQGFGLAAVSLPP